MKKSIKVSLMATATVLNSVPVMAADIIVSSGFTDILQKSVGGEGTIIIQEGGVLSVNNTAIVWNGASTDVQIINDGIIESTKADGRAINAGGSVTDPKVITINNGDTGIIRAENDAVRINRDITGGSVLLTNAGTISSTVSGQAIDFDSIASLEEGKVLIDNLAGGIILSADADAVRPGQGAIVRNAGTIYAGNISNLSSDGVDWQSHSGTVINLEGGVISGGRHGITTDSHVTVINYGIITGRNGSGVGSDGTAHVINYGRITGAYDGSGLGDGDGVDLDYGGTIENFGVIEALGAAGIKKDGRPNGSDGATIGGAGGTVINHAGALIYSVGGAVPIASGTVINDGEIIGEYGGVFIVEGAGELINTGTISGTNHAVYTLWGDDVIINSGTITSPNSAISMGDGNDLLRLLPGSVIIGSVDGGAGYDRIELAGNGDGSFAGATNFELLEVISGNWTLTAPSNFDDGITIDSGAVLIGDANTLTGAISNSGTLIVDQSIDALFATDLSGTGALVKSGSGILTVDDLDYAGTIEVHGGALLINGTMLSEVSVAEGAELRGTGTVGSTTLASGSTLDTNYATALTISGDLVQHSDSLVLAIIGDEQAGPSLVVEGSVVLESDARIAISEDPAISGIGSRYELISASGGITGSYADQHLSVTEDIDLRLVYTDNTVDAMTVRSGSNLSRIAQTANQQSVVAALVDLGLNNSIYAAFIVNPSDDEVRGGMNQLTGEIHGSLKTAIAVDTLSVGDAVRSRLHDRQATPRGLWLQFLGGRGTVDGANGVASVHQDMVGGIGGLDVSVRDNGFVGISGGYTKTTLDMDGLGNRARIGATHLMAYGGAHSGAWRVRLAAGYTWNDITSTRSVAIEGFSDFDRAHYQGKTLHGFAELGYAISYRGGTIEPFARVTALRLTTEDFAEEGGDAALRGVQESTSSVFSDIGVRWITDLAPNVQMKTSAAMQHAFASDLSQATLAFADGAQNFTIEGTRLSSNSAALNLSLGWKPVKGLHLEAGFAGIYGANRSQSTGRLMLGLAF